MVLYLKLKQHFFNEGMQVDIQNKLRVHPKQLSKLLYGHKNLNNKDRKTAKRVTKEEQGSQSEQKKGA